MPHMNQWKIMEEDFHVWILSFTSRKSAPPFSSYFPSNKAPKYSKSSKSLCWTFHNATIIILKRHKGGEVQEETRESTRVCCARWEVKWAGQWKTGCNLGGDKWRHRNGHISGMNVRISAANFNYIYFVNHCTKQQPNSLNQVLTYLGIKLIFKTKRRTSPRYYTIKSLYNNRNLF